MRPRRAEAGSSGVLYRTGDGGRGKLGGSGGMREFSTQVESAHGALGGTKKRVWPASAAWAVQRGGGKNCRGLGGGAEARRGAKVLLWVIPLPRRRRGCERGGGRSECLLTRRVGRVRNYTWQLPTRYSRWVLYTASTTFPTLFRYRAPGASRCYTLEVLWSLAGRGYGSRVDFCWLGMMIVIV